MSDRRNSQTIFSRLEASFLNLRDLKRPAPYPESNLLFLLFLFTGHSVHIAVKPQQMPLVKPWISELFLMYNVIGGGFEQNILDVFFPFMRQLKPVMVHYRGITISRLDYIGQKN